MLDLRADQDSRQESYPFALPASVFSEFWKLYVSFHVLILSYIDENTERLNKYSPGSICGMIFKNLRRKKLIERDVLNLMIEFCKDVDRLEARIAKRLPDLLKRLEDPGK